MESRRLGYLERELGVQIKPMPVPTDADIARRRQYRLTCELGEAPSNDEARDFLDRLLADSDLDEREIATKAIQLLASDRGVSFAPDPNDSPPHWTRPPTKRTPRKKATNRKTNGKQTAFDDKAVALFLPIGRNSGVRAADIVWGLTDATGIPGRLIGRITIHGRNSFVGVAPDVAKRLLSSTQTVSIRGEDVPLSISRRPGSNPR